MTESWRHRPYSSSGPSTGGSSGRTAGSGAGGAPLGENPSIMFAGSDEFRVFIAHNLYDVADAYNRPIRAPTPAVIDRRLRNFGRNVIMPRLYLETPRATGKLMSSTRMRVMMVHDPIPDAPDNVSHSLVITQDAKSPSGFGYQLNVSRGRSAGRMPPYQALMPWVALKFGLAYGTPALKRLSYVIARSIGRRGTRPNHYAQRVINDSAQALQVMANEIGMTIIAAVNSRVRRPPPIPGQPQGVTDEP